MDVKTQSDLLAAIVTCSIAISIWLRSRKHRLYGLFAVFNSVLFLWYFAGFLHHLVRDEALASVRLFIACFIPTTLLQFWLAFLGETRPVARRLLRASAVLSSVFSLLVLAMLARRSSFVSYLIGTYVFIALYSGIYFLYDKHRHIQSLTDRSRLKYLLIGGIIVVTLNLVEFFPPTRRLFPLLGTIVTVTYCYFLSQIIIRFRLLDLYEFLGRSLVMVVLAGIISVIYLMLIVWVGNNTGLLLFNTILASCVVLILIDPLRYSVETRINRLVFFETYQFSRMMERLRRAMTNVINISGLADLMMSHLENSRRVTHASFYLLDDDDYTLKAYVGPQPLRTLNTIKAQQFISELADKRVLIRENLLQELKERNDGDLTGHAVLEVLESLLEIMDQVEADVCIPCISKGRVIALLNVRNERLREAYSSDEIKILISIAAQASVTIENSHLYDKMRERDRLATVGQMAAGMAHEIRNPLGAIKGAAQLLDDDVAGANVEFIGIIQEEVDRLDTVLAQFLDYARPMKQRLCRFSINDLIEKTVQLIQQSEEAQPHAIQLRLDPELPTIESDPELLKQVFFNLSKNAFQAMPNPGRLVIASSLEGTPEAETQSNRLKIRFSDTGEGIAEKELQSIFIPFFTTKTKGTGLGLAICHRIVTALGGTIEVKSAVGKGTSLSLSLPVTH